MSANCTAGPQLNNAPLNPFRKHALLCNNSDCRDRKQCTEIHHFHLEKSKEGNLCSDSRLTVDANSLSVRTLSCRRSRVSRASI